VALVLASCALCLATGCDDEPGDSPTTDAATTTSDATEPERVILEPCHAEGGRDVMIANVTCEEVRETIPEWGPRPVFAKGDSRQDVFLEGGWQCWAGLGRGGILNICMRDDAVIVYKFS
jgi:hypothetical protein